MIADIGSGTGLLSVAFLNAGYSVVGIEPNRDMREASEKVLAGFERFRAVDARAEQTTLPDHSVDLCVAGQAFHWFDAGATRHEWSRILRSHGAAALIWNRRVREGDFMHDVETVIHGFATQRDKDGVIREMAQGRVHEFFSPALMQTAEFPNEQLLDLEGLQGRVLSASYVPNEEDPEASSLKAQLAEVFQKHQKGGKVRFLYRTRIYWALLG